MTERDIAGMKAAHQVLAEFQFEPRKIERGYAGRALRVDLNTNRFSLLPVSEEMKEMWTGGKGFDLWLTFQEVTSDTRWDSPDNPICFSSGPLGGTTSFPGSGKTLVTAISPTTESMMDCNVGGYFGPFLKFAGFDAMVVTGKATEDVVVYLDATLNRVTIETAPLESIDSHVLAEELTEMYADDELDRRNVAVVSAGRGAQHTRLGVLNFSFYDWRRRLPRLKQAGRGGVGTVFRDKGLKALVVKNRGITPAWRVAESPVAKEFTANICTDCKKADLADVRKIIAEWNDDPEYVIEMMQDIQEQDRYLSKDALEELCASTGVPMARLYHIATFYKAFSLAPRGEHVVEVCVGTACHVKGSANVLDAFERELGIARGETTADGKFTIEPVACLGCCSMAPAVRVGEEIFSNVEAGQVGKIIKKVQAPETKVEAAPEGSTAPTAAPGNESLDALAAKVNAKWQGYKAMLMVCTGTGCVAAKGFDIRDEFVNNLAERGLADDYLVVPTGCNGFCAKGPIVVVQPEGVFYHSVSKADIDEIISSHLVEGTPVERLLYTDPVTGAVGRTMDDIGFFGKQQLIALRNKGLIDPEKIEHYAARGGYASIAKVLADRDPAGVVKEVLASGVRGRGGGGFPAGVKWQSCVDAVNKVGKKPYVVCNADEGDPGAFMDRSIIETDPHSVIEGMLIGAFAVGAEEGYIYIRKEYPLAMTRLKTAVAQARALGMLGADALGQGKGFDINIHRGAGAFVCGESTALMASMAGRVGEPRAKYVHNVEQGYRDQPTVLNNVETWANIPAIIEKGAAWFAGIGSGDVSDNPWNGSSGTKVFSLVGDVKNTGLVEVPMGITLREIVEEIGGGVSEGRTLKGIQTGGPSGGCIPANLLDMEVDFDNLTEAGSMMGSGGLIVMDDRTCMVDVARYFVDFLVDESCGKCTPCREGLHSLNNTLTRICNGEGKEGDVEFLEELSKTVQDASLCQLGGSAPNPVLSTIKYFREEYDAHIADSKCPAGVCKPLISYHINDNCNGCTLCKLKCPQQCISGERKELHIIDQEACIKCGICDEVCKFDAVEVK